MTFAELKQHIVEGAKVKVDGDRRMVYVYYPNRCIMVPYA